MVDLERELDRAHVHVRYLVSVRVAARVWVPIFTYGTWSGLGLRLGFGCPSSRTVPGQG